MMKPQQAASLLQRRRRACPPQRHHGLSIITTVIAITMTLVSTFVSFTSAAIDGTCQPKRVELPPSSKLIFKVGVLANRGAESAYEEWNATFAEYMTHTVETDPPVEFQVVPLDFKSDIVGKAAQGDVFDFVYVDPSIHSCIESEVGANPLVTTVKRRRRMRQAYDLDQFGGVIFTHVNRTDINSLEDLRDQRVACSSIASLGSGQMQLQELQRVPGFHYFQHLQQLLFVENEFVVVDSVVQGTMDVGFVRTGILERSRDGSTGEWLNMSHVKILNAKEDLVDASGNPFPFVVSTDLFPEWCLAALDHVPNAVSQQVQKVLMELPNHATVYEEHLQGCHEACLESAARGNGTATNCLMNCWNAIPSTADFPDCSTTPQLAEMSFRAQTLGKYTSWRTALNYMQLRNMQEETGFIRTVDGVGPKCIRSEGLVDAVACPAGHYKKSDEDILSGCEDMGLPCNGFDCLCKPCAKIQVCPNNSVSIRGDCIKLAVLLPSIMVPIILLVAGIVYLYIQHVRRESDSLWRIPEKDLVLEDPIQILGRGTFGLVLLAEYRGTKVAIKRVLPPKRDGAKFDHRLSLFDEIEKKFDLEGGNSHQKKASKAGKDMEGTSSLQSELNSVDNISTDDDNELTASASFLAKRKSGQETGLPDNIGFKSGYTPANINKATGNSSTINSRSYWSRNSISATREYSRLQADFMDEMRQMSKLRHPCITTVMGAVAEYRSEPMLVMEYMELGSLYDMLHNDTVVLEMRMAVEILRDVAQGLRFLHSADPRIVHGDVKAANILLDSKFRAKVADFGFTQKRHIGKRAAGTPFWMAPELLRGESTNTPASDVYAFGIMLFEVFARKDPYEGQNHVRMLKMIADRNIQKRPPVPEDCPVEIQLLMKECLRDDPTMRPLSESIDQRLRQIEIKTDGATGINTPQQLSGTKRLEAFMARRFPSHIAEAIKEGKKIDPVTHPAASVFACEVVNYTNIVSSLSAEKASQLLDIIQTTIDTLCQVHKVFQIETVGDSFLAVANVATDQPDHVSIMANFALDVLESLTELQVESVDEITNVDSSMQNVNNSNSNPMGMVKVRIGLHTGPAVAHVVGIQNPRFSVLGDAIKTAALLESCTKPNKVHISQEFAFELLEAGTDVKLTRVDDFEMKRQAGSVSYFLKANNGGDNSSLWSRPNSATHSETRTADTENSASSQSKMQFRDSIDNNDVDQSSDKVRQGRAPRISNDSSGSIHLRSDELYLEQITQAGKESDTTT